MSDYFTWEPGLDAGDVTGFSGGETDTENRISVDHYAVLATTYNPIYDVLPYRGAYVLHGDLSVAGNADGYAEDVTLATAASGTIWLRFYLKVTNDLVMAASDRFTIAAFQSGASTDEAVICIRNSSGAYQILASETSASATVVATQLNLNRWHLVELAVVVDSGALDGTVSFYLDGYLVGAAIASLTQAAITRFRMGIMGKDAGTTAGHVLFSQIAGGSARIGGFRARFEEVVTLTKSGFVALGPGRLDGYYLAAGGGADNHLTLYDTDIQPILAGTELLGPPLANGFPFETPYAPHAKYYFKRGLYALMTGTAPRGVFKFGDRLMSASALTHLGVTRSR